jgi:hypothetical protein
MPDAGRWLASQGIDYVLWYRPGDTAELWNKVNSAVAPQYLWCDILTYENGTDTAQRVGLWKRVHPAAR